jgi:hypothetical protein
METYQMHSRARLSIVGSWLVTGVVALLCSVLGLVSPRFIEPFAALFQGLAVDLPSPTRLLIETYVWLLPLVFTARAMHVILKEFVARELRRRFLLTASVFVAAIVTVGTVAVILYLPSLALAAKLAKTK